jgi:hypothetical protein
VWLLVLPNGNSFIVNIGGNEKKYTVDCCFATKSTKESWRLFVILHDHRGMMRRPPFPSPTTTTLSGSSCFTLPYQPKGNLPNSTFFFTETPIGTAKREAVVSWYDL